MEGKVTLFSLMRFFLLEFDEPGARIYVAGSKSEGDKQERI